MSSAIDILAVQHDYHTTVSSLYVHILFNVSLHCKSFLITHSKASIFVEQTFGVAEESQPGRTLFATLVSFLQTSRTTSLVSGSVSGFRRCVIHWITTDLTCSKRGHHASYDNSRLYKADQAKNVFSNMDLFIAFIAFYR